MKASIALLLTAGILTVTGSFAAENTSSAAVQDVDKTWQQGPNKAWFVSWDKACAEAKRTKKCLYVLNTGSDWCIWCKRLKADVLEKKGFQKFAKKNLVLVYLDSPMKSPLSKDQDAHNNALRRKLGFKGGVPCAKVIASDGEKQLTEIGGYRPEEAYLQALKEGISK